MLTLRGLWQQAMADGNYGYAAAIVTVAEWCGWLAEATRDRMLTIERLAR